MLDIGVWRHVSRKDHPQDHRLVGCRWVFKVKCNGVYHVRLVAKGFNRILAWQTANPPGVWPQNTHQPGGFEGGGKPGAQLVGFKQATTINALKIGKNT